jgi:hypothetical protein
VKFALTNRGFYSEINNLINAYIYAAQNGLDFSVDASISKLYFSKGFHYYFEPLVINNNVHQSDELIMKGVHCSNFRMMRSECKNIPFEVKREITEKIIKYTFHVQNKINKIIDSLKLPDRYNVIQIRRGDKVNEKLAWTSERGFGESKRYEFDEYISRIDKGEVRDTFVMTDDYKVINEANEYVESNSLDIKLYTLCEMTSDGHSTIMRYKDENYYTENEVINLLAECEIARNSRFFVGTFSSNIGRYIKLTHKNPQNCISMDSSWHPL